MSPINKYEAIGIFASVAVMALVLAFLRTDRLGSAVVAEVDPGTQGAIVVAGEDTEGEQSGLADALYDAATASGELTSLVIDDVRIGTGRKVAEGDSVTVDYIGSTQDGIQFDSSYARGETFTFTVGGGKVIPGWETGLIGMQAGGQRILVIPPSMAYGNRQVGPIPANSVLVFAVELLEVN
jgi:FKBP-type peptidyl-prolyl cis-trans isomerase FkpA